MKFFIRNFLLLQSVRMPSPSNSQVLQIKSLLLLPSVHCSPVIVCILFALSGNHVELTRDVIYPLYAQCSMNFKTVGHLKCYCVRGRKGFLGRTEFEQNFLPQAEV